MIVLTDTARRRILEARGATGQRNLGLRIVFRSSGSPRGEYAMHFVVPGSTLPGDRVVEIDGIRLHLDPDSAPHLENATLDYVETPAGAGFRLNTPLTMRPKLRDSSLDDGIRKANEDGI